jgi:probable HAF family extracellular repeat protein
MNIHHCCTARNLILAAVLTIGFASSALAQDRALFVDLNSKEVTTPGTLGGDYSRAYGINDMGQVVGQAATAIYGQYHAFITGPDGAGMTDLGTLGGAESRAFGINDMGQVVGYSYTGGQTHAFITGPDGVGMTDLGSVVNLPTNFTDFSANAINNHGQLAVEGRVVVIPEPEIYAMLLSGLGLIGFLARGRAIA